MAILSSLVSLLEEEEEEEKYEDKRTHYLYFRQESHLADTHTHTHLYQTLNDVCYSRPSRDGDDDDAKKIFISFTHHFARINGSTEPQSMKNNRSIEKGRERENDYLLQCHFYLH